MNVRTSHRSAATAVFAAMLLIILGACSHQTATTANGQASGEIRTEQVATSDSTATPMSGPAVVDSSGNLYTSSAAGGTGNAATVGTNTNVNVTPQQAKSTVSVTTSEALAPTAPVTTESAVTETTVMTPAAPIVTTPSVSVETTTPTVNVETSSMTSSTTEQETTQSTTTTESTTTTHRRMRKD
jgi:hypothetical protein